MIFSSMLLLIGFSFPLIMHCRELPKVTTQCICNKLSSLCFPPPHICYFTICCLFPSLSLLFLVLSICYNCNCLLVMRQLEKKQILATNPLRTYLLRSKVTRETCHDTAKIQILTRSLLYLPLLFARIL